MSKSREKLVTLTDKRTNELTKVNLKDLQGRSKKLLKFTQEWHFCKVHILPEFSTESNFMMTSSNFGWRHQHFFICVSLYHDKERNMCAKIQQIISARSKVIEGVWLCPPVHTLPRVFIGLLLPRGGGVPRTPPP